MINWWCLHTAGGRHRHVALERTLVVDVGVSPAGQVIHEARDADQEEEEDEDDVEHDERVPRQQAHYSVVGGRPSFARTITTHTHPNTLEQIIE